MKQLPRYQERVLRAALGFVSRAFRPLPGVTTISLRGRMAGIMSTLLSFLNFRNAFSRKDRDTARYRYPNGFNRAREEARRVRQGKKLVFHRDGRSM